MGNGGIGMTEAEIITLIICGTIILIDIIGKIFNRRDK